jgi:ADP-ribose pyrophosphatase YjhB (NUDIX family)
MQRIHLAAALVERDGCVLLVASQYASHALPLWNLPGGRQQHGELLEATALRELHEETGLRGRVRELAYVAESYDGERHFMTCVFVVETTGDVAPPQEGDHVAEVAWVARDALGDRLSAGVVREPLLRYLQSGTRYTGFPVADISVRWFDED